MKKILLISGLVILTIIFIIMAFNRSEALPHATSGSSIIAFGDSLVAGYGATQGHDFPSVLSSHLGVPIINAGVSGDTTSMALARFDKDVLAKDPKVVIILLGGNDFFQRFPQSVTIENLSSMLDKLNDKHAVTILVGFGNGLLGSYETSYERLAKEKSVVFVPNIMSGIFNNSKLMSDSIHPNDAGYQKISDKIELILKEVLK